VLLLDVTHFNYRSNIIEVVVPRMNDKQNEEIAHHCCDSVSKLFKQDQDFDASQEVVKAMARVIKASNYRAYTCIVFGVLSLVKTNVCVRACVCACACACLFLHVVQAWYFRVENIYSAVSKRSIWIFECILPNHPSPSFTHCILGARDEMVLCLINLKLNEAAIRQHREYVESGQKKKEKHKSRMKAKEDKAGASPGVCKV
jgi:hypothetical protein